jgi:hypothetical protein
MKMREGLRPKEEKILEFENFSKFGLIIFKSALN